MQFEDPIVNTDVLWLDPVANAGEHFKSHDESDDEVLSAKLINDAKVNQSSREWGQVFNSFYTSLLRKGKCTNITWDCIMQLDNATIYCITLGERKQLSSLLYLLRLSFENQLRSRQYRC